MVLRADGDSLGEPDVFVYLAAFTPIERSVNQPIGAGVSAVPALCVDTSSNLGHVDVSADVDGDEHPDQLHLLVERNVDAFRARASCPGLLSQHILGHNAVKAGLGCHVEGANVVLGRVGDGGHLLALRQRANTEQCYERDEGDRDSGNYPYMLHKHEFIVMWDLAAV